MTKFLYLHNFIEKVRKNFHYKFNKVDLYVDPKTGNEKIGYSINRIDYNEITTYESNNNVQPSYNLGSTAK